MMTGYTISILYTWLKENWNHKLIKPQPITIIIIIIIQSEDKNNQNIE